MDGPPLFTAASICHDAEFITMIGVATATAQHYSLILGYLSLLVLVERLVPSVSCRQGEVGDEKE